MLSSFLTLSQLIFTTTLLGRCCYWPHFTGKKAEAQRCELTCPRSHSSGRMEPECLTEEFGCRATDGEWGFKLGRSRITVGAARLQGGESGHGFGY